MPVGSGPAPFTSGDTSLRACLTSSPSPSLVSRVRVSQPGESSHVDRVVDPIGSDIVPLEQSPSLPGEVGDAFQHAGLLSL
jgi:hypothetical protein